MSASLRPSRYANSTKSPLSVAIRAALCGGACLLMAAAPARSEDAPAPAQEAATQLAKVEVVGSRIKRVDVETSQPVIVLERADIDRTGLITVGDVLQHIVQHGESVNTAINNGNNGEIRVSLRNLGSRRTLVLVNGKRWVSLLDGAVDLTQIPLAIVERIEVLNDGASAIYGSDAIAGVVNIITRKHYDGRELHAYYGQYQQGDGITQAYDATIGTSRERGSAALNIAYNKQDAIWAGARAISAVPDYGLPPNDADAGASTATPNGRFFVRDAEGNVSILTLIDGRPGTSPDDFRRFDRHHDAYNFAQANYLLTPQERGSAYGQFRYDLSARTTWRTEALFNQRRSSELLAAVPLMINPAFAGLLGNVGISADNLYNPFDVDIDTFSRRFVESGGRRFSQNVDTTRISTGLEGTVDWGGRAFTWDANLAYGASSEDERVDGVLDLQHVANALGPSFLDPQGVARCGVPGDIIAGCVPLDVFTGSGSITAEMASYIASRAHNSTDLTHRSATADITGDLLDLPAGPLGIAAGYEYRREQGKDSPDPLVQSGALSGNVRQSTEGSYSTNEFYLEVAVPVLKDLPLVQSLDLSLAARYSNYSNFGGTTNAKAGFRWKPYADLLVRGNWSQGFRAPSVSELFLGSITGASNVGILSDPCHPDSNPSPATLAHCAAAGVPADFNLPDFTNIRTGGNPELQPETAVTRTLGLVYSPSWLPGFDLYLDWYQAQIANTIVGLGSQTIVDRCYVLGEPNSCGRVVRNAEHQLYFVDETLQNIGRGFETEGYDLSLVWRHDSRFGKWQARWDSAYVDYWGDRGRPPRLTRLPDGTLLQGNSVATRTGIDVYGAEWRLKSNITLDWSRGDWSASATVRYLSPFEEDCSFELNFADTHNRPDLRALCDEPDRLEDWDGDGIGDPAPIHSVEDVWYLDLQAGWDTPWRGHLTVGVRNATDRNPPISRGSFANSFDSSYDIPGRFWYVSYSQSF